MQISAYIPAYNSAGTLARAIAALRRQIQPVAELFVIDDGSTDDSADVAGALAVPVVRHPQNQGRGKVRATAMTLAQHEWVLCCDAAVELAPDFLAHAMTWQAETCVAGVFGRVTRAPAHTAAERWRNRHLFKDTLCPVLERRASLTTGGALLRRSAVLAVGNFDEHLRQAEDADLGRRLLAAGHDVVFDPQLQMEALGSNTLWQAMERYHRWNIPPDRRLGWVEYFRHVAYATKFMLPQDMLHHDVPAAAISLFWPCYLFWKQWARRPAPR